MKYRRIVAAVDETPAGVHALRTGARIAAAAGAELVLLRVVNSPWNWLDPADVAARRWDRDVAWSTVAARQVKAQSLQLAESVGISQSALVTAECFGEAGVEIPLWVARNRADLIIVGRQPPGTLERRPSGRTIEGILRRTSVPCLIVPPGQRTWQRTLVLGRSEISVAQVLESALPLADLFAGEVTVLDASSHKVAAGAGGPEAVGHAATVAWSRAPRRSRLHLMTGKGDPAGQMLRAAREGHADVLAVGYGSQMESDTARTMVRVIHRAPCAVLAVPCGRFGPGEMA